MLMKNPLTLAGIEPATFRFVAQHLNHCVTCTQEKYHKKKTSIYIDQVASSFQMFSEFQFVYYYCIFSKF